MVLDCIAQRAIGHMRKMSWISYPGWGEDLPVEGAKDLR